MIEVPKTTEEFDDIKHRAEKDLASRDVSYFIQEHVSIEDRDTPEVVLPFKLWPRQIETLISFVTERLIQVLKARQLGLTLYGA
jgi:hypothetical protein